MMSLKRISMVSNKYEFSIRSQNQSSSVCVCQCVSMCRSVCENSEIEFVQQQRLHKNVISCVYGNCIQVHTETTCCASALGIASDHTINHSHTHTHMERETRNVLMFVFALNSIPCRFCCASVIIFSNLFCGNVSTTN